MIFSRNSLDQSMKESTIQQLELQIAHSKFGQADQDRIGCAVQQMILKIIIGFFKNVSYFCTSNWSKILLRNLLQAASKIEMDHLALTQVESSSLSYTSQPFDTLDSNSREKIEVGCRKSRDLGDVFFSPGQNWTHQVEMAKMDLPAARHSTYVCVL